MTRINELIEKAMELDDEDRVTELENIRYYIGIRCERDIEDAKDVVKQQRDQYNDNLWRRLYK